jgi:hypothetical protein
LETIMASQPVTTGAPTRAPVIINFPETPISRARLELRLCRTPAALDRWIDRSRKYRDLSKEDRITIGRMAIERGVQIECGEA